MSIAANSVAVKSSDCLSLSEASCPELTKQTRNQGSELPRDGRTRRIAPPLFNPGGVSRHVASIHAAHLTPPELCPKFNWRRFLEL